MTIRLLTFALLLSFSGAFYSCDNDGVVENEVEEAAMETENAMSNLGAEIREESNEMERDFRDARQNIDARMDKIEADMEGASAEAKAEMQEEWNELEAWGNDIDDRMDRVGNNMEAGWKDFKGDVKEGWKNFSKESRATLERVERELENEDMD